MTSYQCNTDGDLWWKSELARRDISHAFKLYREIINQKDCTIIDKFLLQFEALNHLVIAYNKSKFENSLDLHICICTLFEKELNNTGRKKLISTIHGIGFDNIKEAFKIINQDCESELQEQGNLFFYLKKHRLRDVIAHSETDMIKHISYFLNVTIINFNRIRNLGLEECSEKLAQKKGKMAKTIIPLIEIIFDSLLDLSHNEFLLEEMTDEEIH